MGCTSSTPLVTTGSNMLKAASSVAADATQSAEEAVEDVKETLGKTFDTAKESVGTAVTGIAHDLSNAIKEKTDETTNNLMGKLHLNNGNERETTDASDTLMKRVATGTMLNEDPNENSNEDDDDDKGIEDFTQRLSRGPTPTPVPLAVQQDSDSLQTTASEPEIEQALANRIENSPPTPKPSISELERLSAELHDLKTDFIVDGHNALPMVSQSTTVTTEHLPAEMMSDLNRIHPRPSTTEWEKYADQLARERKFHPNEIALRRRIFGPPTIGQLPSTTAIGTTATLMGPPAIESTTETGPARIAVKAMAMTTLTPTKLIQPIQRTESKPTIVPPQYFRDFPRPAPNENRYKGNDGDETSDRYNESNSSPQSKSRDARPVRKRMTRLPTTTSVKKMHRQLTSLIGYGAADRSSSIPVLRGFNGRRSPNVLGGRNFDFNPNRMRVGSPVTRRHGSQSLLPLPRFGEPPTRPIKRFVHRIGSPLKIAPLKQRSFHAFQIPSTPKTHISTSSSSPSRIGLHAFRGVVGINSASPKPIIRSQSRSSRSSTNNSLVIKSACTTPMSQSPSRNSLSNIAVGVMENDTEILTNGHHNVSAIRSLSRSKSPLSPLPDTIVDCHYDGGCKTPLGLSRSPVNNRNACTSSFLSSPRTSPFSMRKSFTECEDKENKSAFITDLSSAMENRQLLTPSPYKVRQRCAVCFNKYVVK